MDRGSPGGLPCQKLGGSYNLVLYVGIFLVGSVPYSGMVDRHVYINF